MAQPEKLFQPIKVGSLEIPNRLVMLAVTTLYGFDGNDRLINFYEERARGGAGLIVIGALQTIFPSRKTSNEKLALYSDSFIPELAELTKVIHDNGSKTAALLATYNYWSKDGMDGTAETVGPSAVALPREGAHPSFSLAEYSPPVRELTVEEILMIEDAIGDAAVRARKAGFDAIELQCLGGNLLHRFTNPTLNIRTDRYGGSAENRLRIITESLANIRKKVGDDYPIICRITGYDTVPWGLGLEDWQEMASILEKAGANAFDIYPRWYETRIPMVQMGVPRNVFAWVADGIKKAVSVPVIAGVRINDVELAEQILADGKADMIGMARALIADPDLPNKARKGQVDEIVMCTACCTCWDDIIQEKTMRCSVNARAGKEAEYVIDEAAKPQKVIVIGGGPSGMEAARVAALRGHRVTLYEKNDKLGGQLLYAVLPPYKDEWNTTINYLSSQLTKLGVTVKLDTPCTIEEIISEKPDAVIVATGAVPCIPDIPGVHGGNVVTAIEVLTGEKETGKEVVIIGGASTGCETAEFLHQRGKKVTILEMLARIGPDYGPMNRHIVIDRLVESGIRLETGTRVETITNKGVEVVRNVHYHEFFNADTVVLATGMLSENSLVKDLEGKVPAIQVIGDAVKVATVKDAIDNGFKAALQV